MSALFYKIISLCLLFSHFLSFGVSFLLFYLNDFKTPKLKKMLMRKGLIVNAVLNMTIILFCLSSTAGERGVIGLAQEIFDGSFSYQDVTRLSISVFVCLLLSMVLTLLCCVLYRRLDKRIDTTLRQRGLLLCVLAIAAVPAIGCMLLGSDGMKSLHISGVCRRYEIVETDEATGKETSENFSSVTIRNDGVLKCEAIKLFFSVEADEQNQVAVPAFSLVPGAEYTLVLPDDKSLQIKKNGGSTVYLNNEWGKTLDEVTVPALEKGEKYSNSDAGWSVIPVPVAETAEETVNTVPVPIFSAESGFYDDPFELTLSAAPDLIIHYTLDCSEPDVDSMVYTEPIFVYDRSSEPNQYAKRADFKDDYLEVELSSQPVKKCMVVRAVAEDAEGNLSPVVTASYFISRWAVNPLKTAVLSIVTSPDALIGPKGILVTGPTYDEWYQKAFQNTPTGQAVDKRNMPQKNYDQHGPEWERIADMQIFEQEKLLLDQPVGIRAQGYSSRKDRRYKRLSIYSRREYNGSAYFTSGVINDLRQHSLVIRFGHLHAMSQLLCQKRDCAVSDFKTVAYYLNGEYLYTGYLHEKFNEKNLAEKYGLTDTNIVIVANGQVPKEASRGGNPYSGILGYLQNHDMADVQNYQEYDEIIDIQSYIDYVCVDNYMANMDTNEFGENSLLYHTIIPENSKEGDTRWRWGLIDMDIGWRNEESGIYADTPWKINAFTMTERNKLTIGEYTVYSALKVNPVFCRQFVLTFMDLVNTIFTTDNTTRLMDEMNIQNIEYYEFFAKRTEYAVQHLVEEFTLIGSQETVTLSSNCSGAPIILNTIAPELIDGKWNGTYFTDYPVTVTANGDGFDHWEVTVDGIVKTYDDLSIDVPVQRGGVQIHAVYQ